MGLTDDDVREILRIIDESALDELRIETAGFLLHVRKGAGGDAPSLTAALPRAISEDASPAAPSSGTPAPVTGAEPPPPSPSHPSGAPEPGASAVSANGLVDIPSPMLGTFYRAESPGAAPFVDVGDRVEPETTVCIIEVMKMMNSVPAGVSGTIAEICTDNAQLVEYGQPLFRVTPDE